MTKFIYKMENILNIKYKMEEQAKTAYGTARMRLTQEEEKLFALKQKKVIYQEKIKRIMQTKLVLLELRQCEEAIDITKYLIRQQEVNVRRAEQQLELARTKLNATMQERKTHEILKENALDEYFLEYESEQRKEVDELVCFKYNNPTDY